MRVFADGRALFPIALRGFLGNLQQFRHRLGRELGQQQRTQMIALFTGKRSQIPPIAHQAIDQLQRRRRVHIGQRLGIFK